VSLTEFAPAKVNLFLHVGRPGADGRHPVCSLVVFANVGDTLEAEPTAVPALAVDGPFADQAGPLADNLVTRALALAETPPMRVLLCKDLPAASGLGGGTADAGAALRLAARLFPEVTTDQIETAARRLGADGLMCLHARPALAEGEGEILSAAPVMPVLPAVLINPGVPSPTGAVYRAYDLSDGAFTADRPDLPDRFMNVAQFVDFLRLQRNDLAAPAIDLAPEIGKALAAVAARGGCLLARMSGSGATVFGLFATPAEAERAAATVAAERPGWWVRSCLLNADATAA